MAITALVVILIAKAIAGEEYGLYLALFVLVAVKEGLMLVGGLVMLRQKKVAYSDWYGKTATGLFAFGIVLTLLSFPIPAIQPWNIAVLSGAIALSYFSMAHYAKTQLFVPRTDEPAPEEERLFEKIDRFSK